MITRKIDRFDSANVIITEGLNLPLIQDDQVAKMLFLSTKPENFSSNPSEGEMTDGGWLIEKFRKARNEKKIDPIRRALHMKLHSLKIYEPDQSQPLTQIESNFSNREDILSNEEEDILIFNEIFMILSLSVPEFLKEKFDEIAKIKKIPVTKVKENNRSNFVRTENKVLSEICDLLSSEDVYWMYYSFLREYKENYGESEDVFNARTEETLTATSDLKDVTFYFLILLMIDKHKLNRLYTHCLECILKSVMNKYKEKGTGQGGTKGDFSRFEKALQLLRRYPVSSYPPGLCIIFHMEKDRKGAENDFKRVKELFENNYGFDVIPKINPKKNEIQDVARKLGAQRNKFYDSLVIWFMGHGTHDGLIVMDETIHRRKEFIHPFSNIDWLNKKPKLFFIQACASIEAEAQELSGKRRSVALEADKDSASLGLNAGNTWLNMYGACLDTSAVNNYADILIAYATTWDEPASRGEGGSLYVQTIVDQLKEHGHNESIENVLRKVHYNTNAVLLQGDDSRKWKQTPYYECSLQKEFVFPKCKLRHCE